MREQNGILEESSESRGYGCDLRSTLQLRQNPQVAANHSGDGGWPERPRLESGRDRDDGR